MDAPSFKRETIVVVFHLDIWFNGVAITKVLTLKGTERIIYKPQPIL